MKKKIKILLLVDEYLPECTLGHAKQMHSLALQYKKLGHRVIVLTPSGPNQNEVLRITEFQGITVWKFKSPLIRSQNKIQRAFREMLLPIRALRALKEVESGFSFDLCIYWSPTIFYGLVANRMKSNNCHTYLVLRDFFPQWAIDKGLLNRFSPVTYFFRLFEHVTYRSADRIGVQSPNNVSIFNKMTKKKYKNLEVLYNWASPDSTSHKPSFGKNFIHQLGLTEKIILFYGGNMGIAQDMPNILRLSERLKNIESAHILLVGQGDEFENICEFKKIYGLDNLTIMASVSQEQYESILQNVSIGVFSLAKEHTSHNIPGKLLGYMQARLPILGSVNSNNDIIDLINHSSSGLVSVNGDDDIFYENAIRLIASASLREKMGQASIELLTEVFSTEKAAAQILSLVD